MPYLHWGYLRDLPPPTESQPKSQAHPRRTLDQADNPYLSADDLNQRNHDQVVTRFLKSSRVQYKDLTCMMVDQLWVWLLDKCRLYVDVKIIFIAGCSDCKLVY
jgi:hypothetical protein